MDQRNEYTAPHWQQAMPLRQSFVHPEFGLCFFDPVTRQISPHSGRQDAKQTGHNRQDSGWTPADLVEPQRRPAQTFAQPSPAHASLLAPQRHRAEHFQPPSEWPAENGRDGSYPPWATQAPLSNPTTPGTPASDLSQLPMNEHSVAEAVPSRRYPTNGNRPRRGSDSSGRASRRSSGPPRPGTLLQAEYQVVTDHKTFYVRGKVFYSLRSENNGGGSHISGHKAWTQDSYGSWIYTKPRPFVVVKPGGLKSVTAPITTYNGQACAKNGVRKADHAIIFTGPDVPSLQEGEQRRRRGEQGLLPGAIRVLPDEHGVKLDPLSRVDFGAPTTIEHNGRVMSFGMVDQACMHLLVNQYLSVQASGNASTATTRETRPRTAGPPAPAPMSDYEFAHAALRAQGWTAEKTTQFLAPTRRETAATVDDHATGTIVEIDEEGSDAHINSLRTTHAVG